MAVLTSMSLTNFRVSVNRDRIRSCHGITYQHNADVKDIIFPTTKSGHQCTKCASDKHQKANISLQDLQYRLQLTPAELAENEHRRAVKAWNKFKPCGLLLEIKEFQAWFNMQCQQSVLWISGCRKSLDIN